MHTRFTCFCLLALNALPVLAEDAAKKIAPPNADQIKQAEAAISDLYKSELASRDRTLPKQLLKLAQETKDDNASKFVLLRKAVDIGSTTGDADTVYVAIDALETTFDFDTVSIWVSGALETLSKKTDVTEKINAAIDKAYQADDYDSASKLANFSLTSARNAKNLSAIKVATAKVSETVAAREGFKKSVVARKTLETSPTDPEANRIVGSFLCFVKKDWAKGVPMLALGDDATLKSVAQLDVEHKDAVAIGDAWNKIKGGQERALYWYKLALPNLTGISKARVAKMVKELGPPEGSWEQLDISQANVMDGFLRISKDLAWDGKSAKGGREVKTKIAFSGGIDITIVARTEKNNLRVFGPNGSQLTFNWEVDPRVLRIARPDGNNGSAGSGSAVKVPTEPLMPNRWYTLRWVVTEQGISVSVDGNVVFSEKKRFELSSKAAISVPALDSDIDLKSLVVKQVR